jgi:SPFH domain / Band 7 family
MEPILLAIALAVIGYTVGSAKIINQGKEAIVERFGRYRRTLKPGLNFAVPLIDTVIVESVREQVLNIAPQIAITKDSVRINFDALIFWRILDIRRAYYAVEDLEEALINIAIASIRSEIANLNLNEVEYSKNKVDKALLHDLDKATAAWAVKVLRVEIQDIVISESESQTNAVSELDLLHVELPGEIDWLAYNKTVEKIFLEKKVEVITQDWKILDEGIKARTLVNIKTFPPRIGQDRIRSDFLISYGFHKNEIDNSKFERTYSGTDEKFKEDVKNMFQQIQGQLQTLMISTSKEINITLNNLNDLVAKSAYMEHDQSRKIEIGSVGRDFTASGQALNLGEMDISGQVVNAINQLPADSSSDQPGIKDLLIQLQKAIEEEAGLSTEDKADLLEQVKALAEAKQTPEPEKREGLIRKARKMFEVTLKGLPDTAKIVEACSKLLPLILKALGLPV